MGALPPISPWTPEDDLLLTKSVEDGASLESLAKGAVQFSRRFTVRELQERWYSLLYDPDISVAASERMMEVIELERSISSLTSNKSSRVEASKESKEVQKRKVDDGSVRRCYYAMRKRIRSDPLNRSDLNFLVPPVENCYGHRNILEDPMGSHFDVGNTIFDGMDLVCPEDINNADGASHKFDLREKGQVETHATEQGNECEEMPRVVHRNMSLGGNSSVVGGIDSSKEVFAQNPFEDDLDMNPVSISDDNNNNSNMCHGLERNHVFNSPVSDSFHHLQYSSPPAIPVWRNMDSTSTMEMAGDSHLRGENPQTGDPFGIPDEARKSSSKYDVIHSETDFQSHIVCDEMETSTSCTQFDLVALSDTLLNLSDDEMLLMDEDGKEIDKYGLNNLLLDSPADVSEDQMLNVTRVDTAVAPEADACICSSASSGQLDKVENDLSSSGLVSVLEEQKPSSASDLNPQLDELCNGVICCTLNTEDLEVPSNEHVIFPSKSRLVPLSRRGLNEASCRDLSNKDNLHKQSSESGLSLVNRELKRFGELHADSQARGNRMGLNRAGERDAKLELPRSESFKANSRHPVASSSTKLVLKTVSTEIVSIKQSYPEIPKLSVKSSDGSKSHFEIGGPAMKQEGQVLPAAKKLAVNTQQETAEEMAPEGAVDPLLSDAEEQPIEDADADLPYFSDIESMILDMDLAPEDPDLYFSRQVAIYQSEDAKRAIIRLEQGAHACMQRAIASHGAFAVLYGRHSKHYIKKPEVLIGRATEDVFVDIDLGKEGRANKISRRQAVIKMDEDGVFHVRNLGKCPILVDNEEVYRGQSLVLHSNCLIEVREMHFIFEQNQARVKQYLDATQIKQGLIPLM